MTVETSSTISELDKIRPAGTDKKSEGDNHIRNLKSMLQQQFPGSGGVGFSKTITATEDEINYSSGLVSNIQGQINGLVVSGGSDALQAPPGTILLFGNDVLPAGWDIVHYGTDGMIRVIDPDVHGVLGSGGIDDPTVYTAAHTHGLVDFGTQGAFGTDFIFVDDTNTESGGVDWSPRYIDAVVGIKL